MSQIVDEVNKEIADTMKRLPGNLLRLIRTIQQMEEWNERHRKIAWKDEFNEIKNKLSQTQKEYEDIYNKLYKSKDFEMLLPQTYEDVVNDFVDSGYIEDRINEQADYLRNEYGNVIISDLNYNPQKEYEAGQLDLYENFSNFSQNEDFKTFCEHYYNEEYDIEEEGTFENNYIDKNGNFDFKTFCDTTYFKSDIMDDLTEAMLVGEKVNETLEQAKEEWRLWEPEEEKTNSAPSFDDDWER